jgi:CheY-like chemotaxis protein
VYLNADPVRLTQVISNLLNNACKFTQPRGRIRLAAERQDSDVVVSVRDTGIGIPADQLSSIFEMFTQIDRSLERTRGGLGIGLTLVKQLVEMHGGTVEAHSEGVGMGSEFLVRLPILVGPKPHPSEEPAQGEERAPRAPLRFLVADDNRDAADSLALLLRTTGGEVHTAYDGQEAVEAATRLRPDVILLDIGMPRLNGHDACRRIRKEAWGKNVVLVAVTGWGQEEDRRKSNDAGFDGHLVKPVQYDALLSLLAGLTEAARK